MRQLKTVFYLWAILAWAKAGWDISTLLWGNDAFLAICGGVAVAVVVFNLIDDAIEVWT